MIDNTLQYQYYKNCLLSLHCANNKGKKNTAKPMLLYALLCGIESNIIKHNKIEFVPLSEIYQSLSSDKCITPTSYPYYFLQSEPFWHLQWKTTQTKVKSPSSKFIRDNIEYAYLDNTLWDLLQDEQIRQDYKNTIENFFFK